MKSQNGFVRYLPPSDEGDRWGLQVRDCGWNNIPPGAPYPPGEHPDSYSLDFQNGRVLDEGQFVLISRGRGMFWSEPSGEIRVEGGTAFVLFPGIAHSYRPLKQTGWREHWVGILGPIAKRFWDDLFNPLEPMIKVGEDSNLVAAFRTLCEIAEHQSTGYQSQLAAKSFEIATLLYGKRLPQRSPEEDGMVGKACTFMIESLSEPIDFAKYAKSIHMSYSVFRRIFRQHTGMAPHQYLLQLRIEKARQLLQSTSLSVEKVAEVAGFTSASYFSRFFKERTGVSPMNCRRQSRP